MEEEDETEKKEEEEEEKEEVVEADIRQAEPSTFFRRTYSKSLLNPSDRSQVSRASSFSKRQSSEVGRTKRQGDDGIWEDFEWPFGQRNLPTTTTEEIVTTTLMKVVDEAQKLLEEVEKNEEPHEDKITTEPSAMEQLENVLHSLESYDQYQIGNGVSESTVQPNLAQAGDILQEVAKVVTKIQKMTTEEVQTELKKQSTEREEKFGRTTKRTESKLGHEKHEKGHEYEYNHMVDVENEEEHNTEGTNKKMSTIEEYEEEFSETTYEIKHVPHIVKEHEQLHVSVSSNKEEWKNQHYGRHHHLEEPVKIHKVTIQHPTEEYNEGLKKFHTKIFSHTDTPSGNKEELGEKEHQQLHVSVSSKKEEWENEHYGRHHLEEPVKIHKERTQHPTEEYNEGIAKIHTKFVSHTAPPSGNKEELEEKGRGHLHVSVSGKKEEWENQHYGHQLEEPVKVHKERTQHPTEEYNEGTTKIHTKFFSHTATPSGKKEELEEKGHEHLHVSVSSKKEEWENQHYGHQLEEPVKVHKERTQHPTEEYNEGMTKIHTKLFSHTATPSENKEELEEKGREHLHVSVSSKKEEWENQHYGRHHLEEPVKIHKEITQHSTQEDNEGITKIHTKIFSHTATPSENKEDLEEKGREHLHVSVSSKKEEWENQHYGGHHLEEPVKIHQETTLHPTEEYNEGMTEIHTKIFSHTATPSENKEELEEKGHEQLHVSVSSKKEEWENQHYGHHLEEPVKIHKERTQRPTEEYNEGMTKIHTKNFSHTATPFENKEELEEKGREHLHVSVSSKKEEWENQHYGRHHLEEPVRIHKETTQHPTEEYNEGMTKIHTKILSHTATPSENKEELEEKGREHLHVSVSSKKEEWENQHYGRHHLEEPVKIHKETTQHPTEEYNEGMTKIHTKILSHTATPSENKEELEEKGREHLHVSVSSKKEEWENQHYGRHHLEEPVKIHKETTQHPTEEYNEGMTKIHTKFFSHTATPSENKEELEGKGREHLHVSVSSKKDEWENQHYGRHHLEEPVKTHKEITQHPTQEDNEGTTKIYTKMFSHITTTSGDKEEWNNQHHERTKVHDEATQYAAENQHEVSVKVHNEASQHTDATPKHKGQWESGGEYHLEKSSKIHEEITRHPTEKHQEDSIKTTLKPSTTPPQLLEIKKKVKHTMSKNLLKYIKKQHSMPQKNNMNVQKNLRRDFSLHNYES
jgi:hypothetical protein